jgi:hypothetical protein
VLILSQNELEKVWNEIPWEMLPHSAKVDFCQFIACIKPAVRTHVSDPQKLQYVLYSFQSLGYQTNHDKNGFLVVSEDSNLSRIIFEIDQSSLPHAASLGRLLGYPKCCATYIDQVGESKIDKVALKQARKKLKGSFSLIDISQYLKGVALISHVPCSYKCQQSLNTALKVRSFIRNNIKVRGFREWATLVEDYFTHSVKKRK